MKNIYKIIQLAKPFHRHILILSLLILILSAVQQGVPFISKFIVDEIEKQILNQAGDIEKLFWLIGLSFLVTLLGTFLDAASQRYGDFIASRLGKFLMEQFYQKIFTLPQKYFDTAVSGKITHQLNRGILAIRNFFSMATNFVFPAMLQSVFTIGILFYYNFLIAILALAIFPLYIGISHYSTKKWGAHEVEKNKLDDITRGRIQEVISNIKLVRSFNTQVSEWKFMASKLSALNKIFDKQSTEYHKLNFTRNIGLEFALLSIALIVFYNTYSQIFSLGEMVLILQLLNQIRMPLFGMSFILERIQEAEAGSKEFFEILQLEEKEFFSQEEHKQTTKTIQSASISFKEVEFEYEDSGSVLKNVSFELHPGETVALVGHSGAGKTTLINLIMKFYEPLGGKIFLNKIPYDEIDHTWLRKHISLVFQENELFSSTVRDNVAYGVKNVSDASIIKALKKANAYDFVMNLPKGLDSEIGERGVKLSGGQKQRLQIARAIMHNTPILILDEATSSLDAKSEKLVQEALESLMEKKLVIIIAHRFSTLQNADKIIVLDDGKISAIGTPSELAKKKGIYSELLRYQIEGNQKLLEKYEMSL